MSFFTFVIYKNIKHYTEFSISAMKQAAIAAASAFAADAKAVAVVFNSLLQLSDLTFAIYENIKHYTELSIAAIIQAANSAA